MEDIFLLKIYSFTSLFSVRMVSVGPNSYRNYRANFRTPSIKCLLHHNSLGLESPKRQESVEVRKIVREYVALRM